jgi:hypothetical protein
LAVGNYKGNRESSETSTQASKDLALSQGEWPGQNRNDIGQFKTSHSSPRVTEFRSINIMGVEASYAKAKKLARRQYRQPMATP